ncbi:DUF599 domain-containing protein [Idiomarina tyrosinivorans]|uniref:DUF599 domain-containing protein n=1 Tax=Idiomarina tyrosinivorans TaxID=1445662 RepID=A0A432ZM21_9GAMM|nr:DUF599 domain-containing protein [Idiomarina tyrosinivorans]RUO78912.1 DUF599 domain-containing protein [Idiomarina tyrosinivorans]
MSLTLLDWFAFACFFCCWVGYTLFARKRAKTTHSLSSILCTLRVEWMNVVMQKENQVADAALIANVERTVTFFASSTILVLAGVITVLANSEEVVTVLHDLPFTPDTNIVNVQFKLAILAMIFVYAFFKFTWAIRQFGFVSVLLGASPGYHQQNIALEQRQQFAKNTAKVIDQSGHEYNNGLRSYYFALAFLAWFLHPALMIAATAVVLVVLYRREYRSRVLRALLATHHLKPGKK